MRNLAGQLRTFSDMSTFVHPAITEDGWQKSGYKTLVCTTLFPPDGPSDNFGHFPKGCPVQMSGAFSPRKGAGNHG